MDNPLNFHVEVDTIQLEEQLRVRKLAQDILPPNLVLLQVKIRAHLVRIIPIMAHAVPRVNVNGEGINKRKLM